jgi:predicted nucleic acid-binding protein
MIDASVAVKWKLRSEPHDAEAHELYRDWQEGVFEVCIPDQTLAEVANALLRACRKHPPQLTPDEAQDGLRELLNLPFSVRRSSARRTITRAFEIARQYNQRVYDCIYVALAERTQVEFWTDDDRLYNALHGAFPFIRRLADYTRRRPTP